MFDSCVPDKYKKWLTLIGGFLIHFTLGTLYTLANMNPYVISYLREAINVDTRYADAWKITAPLAILMSIFSIVSGLLVSKRLIKTKTSIFIGIVLLSSSSFMNYFTIKNSLLLTSLTYSVVPGIGFGFAYVPPLSLTMNWFPQSKGKANSIILFGLGTGSLVLNQVQTLFINPNNYSPDRAYSEKYKNEKYFSQKDLLERIPNCFILLGSIFIIIQFIGYSLLFERVSHGPAKDPADDKKYEYDKVNVGSREDMSKINDTVTKNPAEEVNSIGVRYKSIHDGLDVKDVLKQKSFYILAIIVCFANLGPTLTTSNFKIFGQTFIEDDKFLALIGSIGSIFNAFGRLFWGYLCDKLSFKACFMLIDITMILLICTVYFTALVGIKVLYMLWICGIYFAFTGITILIPTTTAKCYGQKNFNAIYGLLILPVIPSSIITAVISSVYYLIGWLNLFLIAGGFLVAALVLLVLFDVKNSNDENI